MKKRVFNQTSILIRRLVLLSLLLHMAHGFSQSLHSLEPPTNHYVDLMKLDAAPRPENSTLDSIKFFPKSYNTVALLYTMLEPIYLTPSQIDSLKTSKIFPANSSEQTRAELDFLLNWQEKRTKAEKKELLRFWRLSDTGLTST